MNPAEIYNALAALAAKPYDPVEFPFEFAAAMYNYRSSLTQIVQIKGRATRDAPGKRHAQFTNLVAEPGVETGVVTDAVNDMLKAISGALLMEQVRETRESW